MVAKSESSGPLTGASYQMQPMRRMLPSIVTEERCRGQKDKYKIKGNSKGNYPRLAKNGRTWGTRRPAQVH
jgi:hypothetical protein